MTGLSARALDSHDRRKIHRTRQGRPLRRLPDDEAWGPYLSVDDGLKLERVQKALEAGDLKAAAALARVYELTPVVAAE